MRLKWACMLAHEHILAHCKLHARNHSLACPPQRTGGRARTRLSTSSQGRNSEGVLARAQSVARAPARTVRYQVKGGHFVFNRWKIKSLENKVLTTVRTKFHPPLELCTLKGRQRLHAKAPAAFNETGMYETEVSGRTTGAPHTGPGTVAGGRNRTRDQTIPRAEPYMYELAYILVHTARR